MKDHYVTPLGGDDRLTERAGWSHLLETAALLMLEASKAIEDGEHAELQQKLEKRGSEFLAFTKTLSPFAHLMVQEITWRHKLGNRPGHKDMRDALDILMNGGSDSPQ